MLTQSACLAGPDDCDVEEPSRCCCCWPVEGAGEEWGGEWVDWGCWWSEMEDTAFCSRLRASSLSSKRSLTYSHNNTPPSQYSHTGYGSGSHPHMYITIIKGVARQKLAPGLKRMTKTQVIIAYIALTVLLHYSQGQGHEHIRFFQTFKVMK